MKHSSATGTHKPEDGRSGRGACDIEVNNMSYLDFPLKTPALPYSSYQPLEAHSGIFP